jgi:hypothetical protein
MWLKAKGFPRVCFLQCGSLLLARSASALPTRHSRFLGPCGHASTGLDLALLTLIGHPTSGIGCGFCVPEIQPKRRRPPDVVTVVTGPVEPPPG